MLIGAYRRGRGIRYVNVSNPLQNITLAGSVDGCCYKRGEGYKIG